ncbi:hypothetical protein [Candidatus Spyradosoma sp. SGI.093]|uniref:hypothetical protein n=1 Tax=Candidatus Spyradosoma sp. SGI.093 TaxID=3420583 RepID=UPI003CFD2AD0
MNTNENNAAPAENETPADAGTPKKKRRLLKRLAIVAGALVALLLLFVAFGLGSVAKWTINSVGAEILGVDKMSVETLVVRPFGGYVRVENFVVGRPVVEGEDFSQDLMSLEYFEFDFEALTALSRKKIIRTLALKNLRLNYEQLISGATNVGALADRFAPPSTEEPATPDEPEAAAAPAEEIYVAARFVNIDGVRVCLYMGSVPSPLPPISVEFPEGLGLDEDLTPVQFGMRFAGNFMSVFRLLRASGISGAASATVGAVSDAAGATVDAVSGAAGATAGAVSDAASATAGAVSDAAGATADAVSDAANATTDAVLDAGKAVLDIFSGSEKNADASEK